MRPYTFECTPCRLAFERYLPTGTHKSHACPECGESAKRTYTMGGFAFQVPQGKSNRYPNTGVHKDDHPDADRVVGKSSDARWSEVEARKVVKDEVRRRGGTHAVVRHTAADHLDYEAMSGGALDRRRDIAGTIRKEVSSAEVQLHDHSSRVGVKR